MHGDLLQFCPYAFIGWCLGNVTLRNYVELKVWQGLVAGVWGISMEGGGCHASIHVGTTTKVTCGCCGNGY
jgi:hypothetical protein